MRQSVYAKTIQRRKRSPHITLFASFSLRGSNHILELLDLNPISFQRGRLDVAEARRVFLRLLRNETLIRDESSHNENDDDGCEGDLSQLQKSKAFRTVEWDNPECILSIERWR